MVPKRGNRQFWLITDLRLLNEACSAPKFQYEDINTVLSQITLVDQMVTADLKKAFYHVSIRVKDRDIFGFLTLG